MLPKHTRSPARRPGLSRVARLAIGLMMLIVTGAVTAFVTVGVEMAVCVGAGGSMSVCAGVTAEPAVSPAAGPTG